MAKTAVQTTVQTMMAQKTINIVQSDAADVLHDMLLNTGGQARASLITAERALTGAISADADAVILEAEAGGDCGHFAPDAALQRQAEELECLLPRLMRRMLTLERDHPATELPLAQLRVCTILQGGPRTLSAIGEELNISVSATTQIADRLERVNLVERVCGQDDRRTKKLQLSPTGAEMMRSRREQRTLHAAHALAQLDPQQREAALHALQSLMDAVNATVPPAPHEDPLGVRQEQ